MRASISAPIISLLAETESPAEAVIIGEVIFGKIFRNFALTLLNGVLGAVIYYVVYQIVIGLGMSGDDMKLITALIVAVFLAIPYWKGKYFRGKVKPQTDASAEAAKMGGNGNA